MANMFALILVIATLVTGILWCVDKFFFAPKRRERQAAAQAAAGDSLDKATLKKVAPKPGWLETGASVFPVLAIVLIVRSFIYEPFQIPSGSMMPTLLIGDFILVEKFAYGIKDPIYQKTLIETGHPKRGDIVVFKYPEDPKLDYIKRAVGLPGDKVTYDPVSKELTIQPGCSSGQACENALPVTYSNVEPSDFVQTFSRRNGGEATSGFFEVPKNETKENGIRLSERKETLGDVTHRILTVPIAQDQVGMYYQQPGQQLATWIVPPGQYFMMGDIMTLTASSSSRAVTNSPVVVALDYHNRDDALAFVDKIDPRDCRLKVGKEMFTLFGPQFVRELQQRGFDIFLDLKFHDIPNTAAHAVAAAADLGVWMVNVHASGGARMMTAAREALVPFGKDAPLLIAVTVLTSMEASDLVDLGMTLSPADYAERLAALTQKCGLDGVVCSAQEAVRFKQVFGQEFKLVTPGIRPQGSEAGDQRRIMTPEQALSAGVDYMVIGRPVTQSVDPAQTLKAINASLQRSA